MGKHLTIFGLIVMLFFPGLLVCTFLPWATDADYWMFWRWLLLSLTVFVSPVGLVMCLVGLHKWGKENPKS